MTNNLTREKVIREIDELVQRAFQIDQRLRTMEADQSYGHLSFVEVRDAFDDAEKELRLAKTFTCSNEIDFRQTELELTADRQTLAAISSTLDRVERETADRRHKEHDA